MERKVKNVLVVAQHNKTEALRMASGLTLLDDAIKVVVLGALEDSGEAALQLESLEFAEVPVSYIDQTVESDIKRLADDIVQADAVFIV